MEDQVGESVLSPRIAVQLKYGDERQIVVVTIPNYLNAAMSVRMLETHSMRQAGMPQVARASLIRRSLFPPQGWQLESSISATSTRL